MRVDHYQELMDRGWRRSGTLYYKPDLLRACCPHYTIRLRAAEFKPRNEQKKPINKFNAYILGPEYKRNAAMLCPQSREEKRRLRGVFDLTSAVHKAEYDNIKRPVGKKSSKPIEPAHKFQVNLESDSFTEEKYSIFCQYQFKVHKDPASRWQTADFKRFLCSGLSQRTLKIAGKTLKLGSYHQCYRLDGKLVAVGVLDLLPHAVSSVYLFYDPDYSHLNFGKLSALREIDLALRGGYEYYYMGYYIHSCIKMRYKATYRPSFLLDPETHEWNLFDDDYRQKLDQNNYFSPSRYRSQGADVTPLGQAQPTQLSLPRKDTPETTKERAKNFGDDDELELDEAGSDEEDAEIPEGSLFDYNIPGVLTKEQVQDLDLDHWKLVVRDMLIDLEDLRGWEESKLDDPGSIKGIAAEVIAATGPKLLEHSALKLF
ncbi:hypothetical protein B0A52_00430 [Exophiala mesophila]|uniref:arginyltransferase n=1 Tax=Exophiala mesophila TaxID=212818 RepID=A0A438NK21_EXOME|nr:hypothetical protein B0A52_00430 [Exophiala mesophila]